MNQVLFLAGVVEVLGPASGGSWSRSRLGAPGEEIRRRRELAEATPDILEKKGQTGVPVRFVLRAEVGHEHDGVPDEAVNRFNTVLKGIHDDLVTPVDLVRRQ